MYKLEFRISFTCYSLVSAAIHPNSDARRRGCRGGVHL